MTTLEKIRAEIDVIEINGQVDEHTAFIRTGEHVKQMALDIIDKYAEQEPCDDAISRQAVLKQLKSCLTGGETEYQYVKLHIDNIPSVRPQEQTGHWIKKDGYSDCSECGSHIVTEWDFCQKCGARMVEPRESEVKE